MRVHSNEDFVNFVMYVLAALPENPVWVMEIQKQFNMPRQDNDTMQLNVFR